MNIIVLGGGNSPERDVSLRSAAAVVKNLQLAGYEVGQIDPKDGLPDLDPTNDLVFPILHGQGGEDGSIQEELEKRHVPYLGTQSQASVVCFDKRLTRKVLAKHGLPIAEGDVVSHESYRRHLLTRRPHVLKVTKGGSSIGTYIVRNPDAIDDTKVNEVFELDQHAIIEELIEGIEITIPILDTKALPVVEIVPPADGEFDYENKYNGRTAEHCPPISVSKENQQKAQKLAEEVHRVLGARHLSRIDMILRPDGEVVVLELNTIPGMTEQSLYPLSAEASGINMPELMGQFVGLVRRDYKLK